jgi:ABC-2 type transport system permease protein
LILAPEALSPLEISLQQSASIVRRGAVACAAVAGLVVLAALLAVMQVLPYETLRGLLLFRDVGPADAGLTVVVLLSLLNTGVLLVLMVGIMARELWTLPALWILAAVNLAALVLLGFTPGIVAVIFAGWAAVSLVRSGGALRVNPVMLKELRGRMRGVRAFVVLSVYLGLMSGFAILLYLVFNSFTRGSGSAAAGEVGRVLFMGIVGIELLLILFIAPAFTSGAITGERERQTYDLLQTTLLSNPSFVMGKLEAALGYILLLLLAAIPLQSIAFLFGGVSEVELILSFVLLAVTAVALGTIGIFFSAVMPRTLTASVRAYSTIVGAMFVAPVVISVVLEVVRDVLFGRGAALSSPLIESILAYLNLLLTSINPITTALASRQLLIDRQVLGLWNFTLTSDGSTIPMISPWILFTIIYLAVSAVLLVLAIRRTRTAEA